jgi:hypothetical protein
MSIKRPCAVCGLEFKPVRNDAKTCSNTCRKRRAVGRLAYIAELPQVQQRARRALHQAIEDAIAIERVVRTARLERRKLGRRAVIKLAPLRIAPRRGGRHLRVTGIRHRWPERSATIGVLDVKETSNGYRRSDHL